MWMISLLVFQGRVKFSFPLNLAMGWAKFWDILGLSNQSDMFLKMSFRLWWWNRQKSANLIWSGSTWRERRRPLVWRSVGCQVGSCLLLSLPAESAAPRVHTTRHKACNKMLLCGVQIENCLPKILPLWSRYAHSDCSGQMLGRMPSRFPKTFQCDKRRRTFGLPLVCLIVNRRRRDVLSTQIHSAVEFHRPATCAHASSWNKNRTLVCLNNSARLMSHHSQSELDFCTTTNNVRQP